MAAFSSRTIRLKFRPEDSASPSGVDHSVFEKRPLLGIPSERAPVPLPDLPERFPTNHATAGHAQVSHTNDDVLLALTNSRRQIRRTLDSEHFPHRHAAEKERSLCSQETDDSSSSSSDYDSDDDADGRSYCNRPRHHILPGENREDGRVHRIGGVPFRDISAPLKIGDMNLFSAIGCAELRNKQLGVAQKFHVPNVISFEGDGNDAQHHGEALDRTKSNHYHRHDLRRLCSELSSSDVSEEGLGSHKRSSSESSDGSAGGIIPHLLSFGDDEMGPCHNNCGFSRSSDKSRNRLPLRAVNSQTSSAPLQPRWGRRTLLRNGTSESLEGLQFLRP